MILPMAEPKGKAIKCRYGPQFRRLRLHATRGIIPHPWVFAYTYLFIARGKIHE